MKAWITVLIVSAVFAAYMAINKFNHHQEILGAVYITFLGFSEGALFGIFLGLEFNK